MSPQITLIHKNAKVFSAWLAIELASTIYGNKPATILSMVDTKILPLFKLWNQYGEGILSQAKVQYLVLRQSVRSKTILFYHPEALRACIEDNEHKEFLRQCGYDVEKGLEACLELLLERYEFTCPHEIGILLGIPLKDVLGFMGLSRLPLSCKGLWNVYGDPCCSLATMECFRADRLHMEERIRDGCFGGEALCG